MFEVAVTVFVFRPKCNSQNVSFVLPRRSDIELGHPLLGSGQARGDRGHIPTGARGVREDAEPGPHVDAENRPQSGQSLQETGQARGGRGHVHLRPNSTMSATALES